MADKTTSTKKGQKSHYINVRFGIGSAGQDWDDVLSEAARDVQGDKTNKTRFIREILIDNDAMKRAAKKLGIELKHPSRGTYDREAYGIKKVNT